MEQAEKDLRELVKLLTIEEISDSGMRFYPTKIQSCRCMDLEKISMILDKYKQPDHIPTEPDGEIRYGELD